MPTEPSHPNGSRRSCDNLADTRACSRNPRTEGVCRSLLSQVSAHKARLITPNGRSANARRSCCCAASACWRAVVAQAVDGGGGGVGCRADQETIRTTPFLRPPTPLAAIPSRKMLGRGLRRALVRHGNDATTIGPDSRNPRPRNSPRRGSHCWWRSSPWRTIPAARQAAGGLGYEKHYRRWSIAAPSSPPTGCVGNAMA